MPDEDTRPKTPRPPHRPTLDTDEQGAQSLALVDALYDAAQDDAIEETERPSPAAHRLVAATHAMLDDLARRTSGDVVEVAASRAVTAPGPVCADIDTAPIAGLSRAGLEELITQLQRQRGEAPVLAYDSCTDDELRQLAVRLRPPRSR